MEFAKHSARTRFFEVFFWSWLNRKKTKNQNMFASAMKRENTNQDDGRVKEITTTDASTSEMYRLKLLNSILIEENKKLKQQNEALKDENRKLQDKNKTMMADEKELQFIEKELQFVAGQTTKIQQDNFQHEETFPLEDLVNDQSIIKPEDGTSKKIIPNPQDKNKTILAEKELQFVDGRQTTKIQQDNFQSEETFKTDPLEDLVEDQSIKSEDGTSKNIIPNSQDSSTNIFVNNIFDQKAGCSDDTLISKASKLPCGYKCGICNKTFKYQSLFKNHYKITHQNVKEFDCEFCNKSFGSSAKMVRHVKDVHYDIKNYKCNSCDKAFCQKTQLQAHVKSIHEDSKDNVCDRCNKSFSLSSNLKVHIANVHEKLLKFVCKICQKRFNYSSSYNRHITKFQHR